jgi:hypothetical protein
LISAAGPPDHRRDDTHSPDLLTESERHVVNSIEEDIEAESRGTSSEQHVKPVGKAIARVESAGAFFGKPVRPVAKVLTGFAGVLYFKVAVEVSNDLKQPVQRCRLAARPWKILNMCV